VEERPLPPENSSVSGEIKENDGWDEFKYDTIDIL
jgi:hypothetical protein